MTKILATFIGQNSLVVTTDERPYSIDSSHVNFQKIMDLFCNKINDFPEWEDLEPLLDIAATIRKQTVGSGVEISESGVTYNGEPLDNAVVSHLLQLLKLGVNLEPWKKFVNSLMDNPSFRSREQLYRFMAANQVTIDQNGDLLLYKKVRSDYYDVYTGRTYLNTVGAVIEMDRIFVDDDPNRTCSAGLHVAAHSYIPSFSGERVVICAVSPRDVVSIPTDYNNAKMRVCKYRVVAEQKSDKATLNDAYYDTSSWDDLYDEDDRNGY